MFFKTIGLINQQVNILDKKKTNLRTFFFFQRCFGFLLSDCIPQTARSLDIRLSADYIDDYLAAYREAELKASRSWLTRIWDKLSSPPSR